MIDKRFISFVFEYCRQNTINYVSELLKGKEKKMSRWKVLLYILQPPFYYKCCFTTFYDLSCVKAPSINIYFNCINVYGMNYNGTKMKNRHSISKTLFSLAENIGTRH